MQLKIATAMAKAAGHYKQQKLFSNEPKSCKMFKKMAETTFDAQRQKYLQQSQTERLRNTSDTPRSKHGEQRSSHSRGGTCPFKHYLAKKEEIHKPWPGSRHLPRGPLHKKDEKKSRKRGQTNLSCIQERECDDWHPPAFVLTLQ